MRRLRVPRLIGSRAEHFGLAAALMSIGLLVAWWAVYALRMIGAVQALSEENARLRLADDPAALAERLVQTSEAARRSLFMIEGESLLFALLLFLSVSFLFLMARSNRRARERMERQLQVTTHELKTPIAGVRALLQTLRRGAVPEELQQDLLIQGLHATDRLEHIAETMLACQRAAAGRARPQVLSAGELVRGVLQHRASTGVAERAEVALGPEVLVRADPDGVRVILENLLDNAQKYADGAVAITGARDGSTWSVSVVDDGPGLSPEDAEQVFEAYERRQGASVAHGSGLGLSLSRELARAMGGELRAVSQARGAVFTLELPIARSRPSEAANA